ncbi:MAG: response regulator [Nitrospira sp.]|nr:response regulator [Nitrospira sp.]
MAGELILIIEDNDKNLKLVRDLLQFNGYETAEAMTAEDGLVLARSQRPVLILMDIQLPGMDGFAALRQLRADPITKSTLVIAVTASAMERDRQKILEAGFNGYLTKPIQVKAFTEEIRTILAKR